MFAQINDATREREEKLMDSYQERTFLQPTRVLSARTLHGCVTYDGESFYVYVEELSRGQDRSWWKSIAA